MVAHTCNPSTRGSWGGWIIEVRNLRPAWPTWWNPVSTENTKFSQVLVHTCNSSYSGSWDGRIICTQEVEPAVRQGTVSPLHSSLGDRAKRHLKKRKKMLDNQSSSIAQKGASSTLWKCLSISYWNIEPFVMILLLRTITAPQHNYWFSKHVLWSSDLIITWTLADNPCLNTASHWFWGKFKFVNHWPRLQYWANASMFILYSLSPLFSQKKMPSISTPGLVTFYPIRIYSDRHNYSKSGSMW